MINRIILYLFIFWLILFNNQCFSKNSLIKKAWEAYNKSKFEQAEKLFREIIKKEKTNGQAWEGYLWTLYKEKKFQEIVSLSNQAYRYLPIEKYYLIYGWTFYQLGKIEKAEKFFNKIIHKKKKEALTALFWISRKKNNCENFYRQYKKEIPLGIKDDVFLCIAEENINKNPKKTLNFLKKIKNQEKYNKIIRKIKFLALLKAESKEAKDLLIKFSELEKFLSLTNISQKRIVYGEESFFAINSIFRKRQGKRGEGKIKEISFPEVNINMHQNDFLLNISPKRKYLTDAEKSDTYQSITITLLKLVNDYPYYKTKISLNLEPINAQIKPKISFYLENHFKSFNFSIFRELVKDSLLSTCGQKYQHLEWGRIYKTGAKIGIKKKIKNGNFLLELGLNRYKGKNTIENREYWINSVIGKNYFREKPDLWLGFFIFLTHFEKNTNFFRATLKDQKEQKYYLPAYGHGGYFSPKYLLSLGPIISIKGKDNKKFLWNISSSLSLSFFQTEDSYLWPKKEKRFPDIIPSEIKNKFSWIERLPPRGFKLKGDTSSSIGGSFKADLLYLVNNYLALGTHLFYQRSADFYELYAGFSIRLFWDKRVKLYYSPVTPALP